jgi:hypothetical protein
LILEPLYFGVVPETVLPIVAILVPVVILAGILAWFVNRYLEPLVKDARRELDALKRDQKAE